MEKLFGIENLKKGVKLALEFTQQGVESAKGGFKLIKLVNFFDEALQIPGVAKVWPQIMQEVKELDTAERTELVEYVKENFDIPDDKVEAVVEHSLAWIVDTIALFEQWKDIKK